MFLTDSGQMVSPAAGRAGSGLLPGAEEDRLPRAVAKVIARREAAKQLRELLGGTVYEATFVLPRIGAAPLGPVRDRHGRDLRWSIWAPRPGVLIDVFRRALPPPEELEDREAFAAEHGLLWLVVSPGERLSLERVAELIAAPATRKEE